MDEEGGVSGGGGQEARGGWGHDGEDVSYVGGGFTGRENTTAGCISGKLGEGLR